MTSFISGSYDHAMDKKQRIVNESCSRTKEHNNRLNNLHVLVQQNTLCDHATIRDEFTSVTWLYHDMPALTIDNVYGRPYTLSMLWLSTDTAITHHSTLTTLARHTMTCSEVWHDGLNGCKATWLLQGLFLLPEQWSWIDYIKTSSLKMTHTMCQLTLILHLNIRSFILVS